MSRAANFAAGDSLNLLCWTCPAGGDWACRSLAFFVPGNRRQFTPLLCPLCRLSDWPRSRCSFQRYPARLMHPRLATVWFGIVARMCVSISAMRLGICGQWAMVRLALPSRHAALREQPQSGALCTRRPTTRSRSSPPSIWSLAEPQINVLAGYVAGFPAWAYSTRILLAEKVAGWWTCSKNRWEAGTRIKCVLLEAAVPTAQVAFVPSTDRACGKGSSCDGHSNIADWRALLRRLNDKMHGHSRSGYRSTSLRHNLRG
ncbi:hypothetical protein GGD65_007919 [Bradyrhizobium sp. CIR18]|nr:hypothetical protein [Bradyrhizobium sp. CIR18]